MEQLPQEILETIAHYLDSQSLYCWSQTSKRYNFSHILKNRLKISWTDSHAIIMALLNALERHDDRLVDYIFKRIESSFAYESDALTANMAMIYRYDILRLDPRLASRFTQLQVNTNKCNRQILVKIYSLEHQI